MYTSSGESSTSMAICPSRQVPVFLRIFVLSRDHTGLRIQLMAGDSWYKNCIRQERLAHEGIVENIQSSSLAIWSSQA